MTLFHCPHFGIHSTVAAPQLLKFFFARIKRNDTGFHPEYLFVSPCGPELNFIKPADTPFVFTDLDEAGDLQLGDPVSSAVPFDCSALPVSASCGRLYHPMPRNKRRPNEQAFGLIRSQLAVRLSECMEFESDSDAGCIVWDGQSHPLRELPAGADVAVKLA